MKNIDFYVNIIDNYGDMGFALNLAISILKDKEYINIIIYTNDIELGKKLLQGKEYKGLNFQKLDILYQESSIIPATTIFNFFKNPLPIEILNKHNFQKTIINFDYLTFDKGYEKFHMENHYLSNETNKIYHYVPGCVGDLGGVIVDRFEEAENDKFSISIFSYEKEFKDFSDYLKSKEYKVYLCGEKTQNSFNISGTENIHNIDFLNIEDYGKLLSICDINFVRGENSVIQSLSLGKITVWDIYKENNNDHWNKLEYFFEFINEFFDDKNLMQNYRNLTLKFNKNINFSIEFEIIIENIGKYKKAFQEIGKYILEKYDMIDKLQKYIPEK